jgi:hypothetical protein
VSILAAAALALSVWAPPPLGATYAQTMSAPLTTSVGQPVVIQATGVKPPPSVLIRGLRHACRDPRERLPGRPAGAEDAEQLRPASHASRGS